MGQGGGVIQSQIKTCGPFGDSWRESKAANPQLRNGPFAGPSFFVGGEKAHHRDLRLTSENRKGDSGKFSCHRMRRFPCYKLSEG